MVFDMRNFLKIFFTGSHIKPLCPFKNLVASIKTRDVIALE